MGAQGWCVDPFGVHEQRWFSAGKPTGLVRDGDVTANDAPPRPTWDGPVVVVESAAEDPRDLRRADDGRGPEWADVPHGYVTQGEMVLDLVDALADDIRADREARAHRQQP